MEPRHNEVRYLLAGGFYSLAFVEWGDPDAPPVVSVHGLTRNARDFDTIAAALAPRFHVMAVDLPGRGGSDWLPEPAQYAVPTYVHALAHLLAAIGQPVRWIGTSLGGICGMAIAAIPGHPIERMVLNDIGPFVPKHAMARIREYLTTPAPTFPTLAALETHLRVIHRPFGPLDDAGWAHLARHGARTLPDGRLTMHYDPNIVRPIAAEEATDLDLWGIWDRITVPMLVVRGAESDLLEPPTLERMEQKPGTRAITVPDAGHAPALMDDPTIHAIRQFLLED